MFVFTMPKEKKHLKKSIIFTVLYLFITTVSSFAQDYKPFELFAGYNFTRFGDNGTYGTVLDNGDIQNANGWNLAFAGNFNSVLSIKGEVSGAYSGTIKKIDGVIIDRFKITHRYNSFMLGPQVNLRRHSPVTPFAHFLIGFANYGQKLEVTKVTGETEHDLFSTKHIAMAVGGGVDVSISRHIGLRGQFDYYPTMLSNGFFADPFSDVSPHIDGKNGDEIIKMIYTNETLNTFRITAGIVFKLGN